MVLVVAVVVLSIMVVLPLVQLLGKQKVVLECMLVAMVEVKV
jgi:hypothetical protein